MSLPERDALVAVTERPAYTHQGATPGWLWWTLLIGAAVQIGWALFLFSFHTEPSAVGRIGLVLTWSTAYSALAAVIGVAAAIGLVRGAPWARTLAAMSATAMTLSAVGAIAGIPVLIGLYSSRKLS